ncbi:MAG: invasion associated locus B family protein [Parvibaculaceae bacterium]
MDWLKRLGSLGTVMAAMLATGVLAAASQEATGQGNQSNQAGQANPAKQKAAIPWSSTCSSGGRALPLECAIEQRAFVRETGQLIGLITIRVPADTKKPVAMIQAPLGLFIPAGITVDVDGDMAQNYPLQTCNANGCYAGFPITDQLLARMLNGGKLNVIFQYLDKKPFTLPMSLTGFTEAFGRIK